MIWFFLSVEDDLLLQQDSSTPFTSVFGQDRIFNSCFLIFLQIKQDLTASLPLTNVKLVSL